MRLKKAIWLIVMLAVFLAALPAAGAAGPASPIVRLDILTVNDFHGALAESGQQPGAAKLAQYLKDEIAKNPAGTLVLSAGDMFQGSADSNLLYGKPVVAMMNEVGFTAMAVGNHEFDWGSKILRDRIQQSRFPYLAANIMDKTTGRPADFVQPYVMLEKMGVTIAIIGLATPETAYKANPRFVAAYDFTDPVKAVNSLVPELRKKGAAIIIVLSHLGCEQDPATREITGEAADLAKAAKGIDVLVTGHSHQVIAGKINGVSVVQAGHNGKAVAKVSLAYTKAEREILAVTEKVASLNAAELSPDPAVGKLLAQARDEAAPVKNRIVGSAAGALPHDKNKLSVLGQWASDAMRQTAGADIAFQNGGGLRTGISAGPVTMGVLYEVLPFDNTLVTTELTGQQVLEVLEHGIKNPKLGMLQYSGIKVKYDAGMPAGKRIVEVTLADGRPLDLKGKYRVATNDFMAAGGDGYTVFKDSALTDTFVFVRDILANAVKKAGSIEFQGDDRFMEAWINRMPVAA